MRPRRWAQQHRVLVTVIWPTTAGGTEVLPERVAVLAVCLLLVTQGGKQETTGSVKAILKDVGIPLPDKMWASARPARRTLGGAPEDGFGLGGGATFERGAEGELRPGTLHIGEPYEMASLDVLTRRTCPIGSTTMYSPSMAT